VCQVVRSNLRPADGSNRLVGTPIFEWEKGADGDAVRILVCRKLEVNRAGWNSLEAEIMGGQG